MRARTCTGMLTFAHMHIHTHTHIHMNTHAHTYNTHTLSFIFISHQKYHFKLICSCPYDVMRTSSILPFCTAPSVTHTCASSALRHPILHALYCATSVFPSQRSRRRTPSVCTTPCTWWSLPVWRTSARARLSCVTSARTTVDT